MAWTAEHSLLGGKGTGGRGQEREGTVEMPNCPHMGVDTRYTGQTIVPWTEPDGRSGTDLHGEAVLAVTGNFSCTQRDMAFRARQSCVWRPASTAKVPKGPTLCLCLHRRPWRLEVSQASSEAIFGAQSPLTPPLAVSNTTCAQPKEAKVLDL